MKFSKSLLTLIFAIEIAIWLLVSRSLKPLIIIAAILIHEVGHVTVSVMTGSKLTLLDLQIGGLKLSCNKGYKNRFAEVSIALGGPLFNVLSTLPFIAFRHLEAKYFVQLSLGLALLNLLPIREFDGGRVFERLLAVVLPLDLALKIGEIISFFTLFSLWCISIYLILRTGRNLSFFIFSFSVFFRMLADPQNRRICKIMEE